MVKPARIPAAEEVPVSPLLKPTELASILGCSRAKAYALKSAIPHVRIGGHVRYRAEDVDEYVERQRSCPRSTNAPAVLTGKQNTRPRTASPSRNPRVAEIMQLLKSG